MSVQDTLHSVTVPTQAGPVDPPPPVAPALPAPAADHRVGRDRPLLAGERMFVLGIGATFGVLATYIVTFLLLAEYVW